MKPSLKKLQQVFETMQNLYIHEQKESGMVSPAPYTYAKDKDGRLVVYFEWKKDAEKAMRLLKEL